MSQGPPTIYFSLINQSAQHDLSMDTRLRGYLRCWESVFKLVMPDMPSGHCGMTVQ